MTFGASLSAAKLAVQPERARPMKILYVEDNDDNAYMLKNRLTRAGFTVVVATDGAQGVAMAASERPDLILMDLTLPDIDGKESADQSRPGHEAHSGHCPHGECHDRRQGNGDRRRL